MVIVCSPFCVASGFHEKFPDEVMRPELLTLEPLNVSLRINVGFVKPGNETENVYVVPGMIVLLGNTEWIVIAGGGKTDIDCVTVA